MHAPVTRFVLAPAPNTLDYPGTARDLLRIARQFDANAFQKSGKCSIAPESTNKRFWVIVGVRNKLSTPQSGSVDNR